MKVQEALNKLQCDIVALKSRRTKMYSYRNLEDICAALKPLLKQTGATIFLVDEPVVVGDRFYIKATATLTAEGESLSVSAFAREQDESKGMSPSQVTGSASSYARKYALSGLLLLDDNKDTDMLTADAERQEDAPNDGGGEKQEVVKSNNQVLTQTLTMAEVCELTAKAKRKGVDIGTRILPVYGIKSIGEMTPKMYEVALKKLDLAPDVETDVKNGTGIHQNGK